MTIRIVAIDHDFADPLPPWNTWYREGVSKSLKAIGI
jgi:hypothetical protein